MTHSIFDTQSRARLATTLGLVAVFGVGLWGCGNKDKTESEFGYRNSTPRQETPVASNRSQPKPVISRENAPGPGTSAPIPSTPSVTPSVTAEPVTYADAEAVYREKRYAEAAELFASYTETKSENPWGFYMLGLSAWKAGENDVAEEAFTRSLELDSTHVKSLLNLSRVLVEEDRAEDAMPLVQRAVALDETSTQVRRVEGRVMTELGRTDEAIDAYTVAIHNDPSDVWALNNLGLILIREGRFEDALAPLARATQIVDDEPVFQNNLGVVLERLGHVDEAAVAYQRALELDGNYAKASLSLVRVEAQTEDPGLGTIDLAGISEAFLMGLTSTGSEMATEVEDGSDAIETPVMSSVEKSEGNDQEK